MESLAAGIFALVIGTVGFFTGIVQFRNRRRLNMWPTTAGHVMERGTFQTHTGGGPPAFRYCPLVRYSYQVNGKQFTNDAIKPKRIQLPPHNTRKWAQKRADSFPDDVIVHYNPVDPSEAYLVQTTTVVLSILTVVSGFVVLVGVVILLMR